MLITYSFSFFSCISFPPLSLCFFPGTGVITLGNLTLPWRHIAVESKIQAFVQAKNFELRWSIRVRNCVGEKTKPWTDIHSDLLLIERIIEDY